MSNIKRHFRNNWNVFCVIDTYGYTNATSLNKMYRHIRVRLIRAEAFIFSTHRDVDHEPPQHSLLTEFQFRSVKSLMLYWNRMILSYYVYIGAETKLQNWFLLCFALFSHLLALLGICMQERKRERKRLNTFYRHIKLVTMIMQQYFI